MPVRQDTIASQLSDPLKTAFERTVSLPRWIKYLSAAGFHENRALNLYLWNSAVGQSFLFPLQAAEVALRNVIGGAIVEEFGENWWKSNYCRDVLGPNRRDDIDKAATRIRSAHGIEPESGHIIASLMLGFWCALLKREFDAPLWDEHVQEAFPFLGGLAIQDVDLTAMKIRDIRNRIAHHEPLIRRNLSEDYAAILKMLGWICPETREWVRKHASVPAVLRMRP